MLHAFLDLVRNGAGGKINDISSLCWANDRLEPRRVGRDLARTLVLEIGLTVLMASQTNYEQSKAWSDTAGLA
jgi:hypothetical protein